MKYLIPCLFSLVATVTLAERPNVLFISIDDMRPAFGAYGYPDVIAPNLDRLAGNGVLFERAYCNIPVCGASRASMMTGILPTLKRFNSFKSQVQQDTPDAVTLPQVFKDAGYATLSFGKIFHQQTDTGTRSWTEPAWRPDASHSDSFASNTNSQVSERGRGLIYEHPDVADDVYFDGKVAAKTIEALRAVAYGDQPFFIATGFVRPHLPFYAPKKYWDLYDREQLEIADNRYRPKKAPKALVGSSEFKSYHHGDYTVNSDAWHRMMRHGYLASVSYVDALIGKILDELDALGLSENTIVVLWGDHGFHLGEHDFWGKHNTMQPSLQIPLIIKVSGKQGRTEALVETVDIFPTLCELADLEIPEQCQGESFMSVLEKPDQDFREFIYARFRDGDTVITDRYAFTQYSGKNEEIMLYDLERDPDENVNQAKNPEYAKVLRQMKQKLSQGKLRAAAY